MVKLVLKAVAIFTLVTGGYSFLILMPKRAAWGSVVSAREVMRSRHINLAQNRLSFTELVKMDPGRWNFSSEKDRLREAITESRKLIEEGWNKGLPELEGELAPLNERYRRMIEEEKDILASQEKLMADYDVLDAEIGQIFQYDPAIDLSQDTQNRAARAADGLRGMNERLSGQEQTEEMKRLRMRLSQGVEVMERIAAGGAADEATSVIAGIKLAGYAVLIKPLTSQEAVDLVTWETNLLKENRFWFEKLREENSQTRGN